MYDIRESDKKYVIRKLADGECWMTEALTFPLTAGVETTGAYNTSATPYTFTPTSCSTDGSCPMNGDTFAVPSINSYYYNWYAATAGTGTTGMGIDEDAPASICPVGWRLPPNYSVSQAKSYQKLTNTYGYTSDGNHNTLDRTAYLKQFPFSFILYGFTRYGALEGYTVYAGYQSSTAWNTSAGYYFYFDASYTWPQYANVKQYGLSVRCVAL